MATLKVNVNKLNVRTSPVKDFDNKENVVGVLQKNAVFESVSLIENELGLWHVNAKGDTISAKFVSAVEGDIPPELMKYHDKIPKIFLDFHLGKLWELPMQEGLKVGIIDNGVDEQYSAIKGKVIPLKSDHSISNTGNPNHATTMACIIAGNDPENGIIGVAPQIREIYSYAFPDQGATPEDFMKALQAMENENVKLINISYGEYADSFRTSTALQQKITDMAQRGFVIFAASGNNSVYERLHYPAAYNDILSVAGIRSNMTQNGASDFWDGVSVCMCSDFYFDKERFKHANATSAATAIMTGSIAHVIETIRNGNGIQDAIDSRLKQLNKVGFVFEKLKVSIPVFDGVSFYNLLKPAS